MVMAVWQGRCAQAHLNVGGMLSFVMCIFTHTHSRIRGWVPLIKHLSLMGFSDCVFHTLVFMGFLSWLRCELLLLPHFWFQQSSSKPVVKPPSFHPPPPPGHTAVSAVLTSFGALSDQNTFPLWFWPHGEP